MGLIDVAKGTLNSVVADQWREYFYCDSIDADVICVKGQKRSKNNNNKGMDNIISNGSVVAVNAGQCMIIVDNGKVVDICAEQGEYVYDMSTEPTILYGNLGKNIVDTFKNIGKRFTFGGEIPKDQRVYFFNTKEITGNKYGTPNPIPFRVKEAEIGLSATVRIKCFGEYSYRVVNPILFYTNVCANVVDEYRRSEIDSQLKTELLSRLQPAFAKIAAAGIHYDELPGHTMEIANALKEELTGDWTDRRGLEIVAFGVSSVTANEEDEKKLQDLQFQAAYRDPGMAAAGLAQSKMEAMKTAAGNSAGAMTGFMGMGFAANSMSDGDLQGLFGMAGQQQAPAQNVAAAVPTAAPKPTGDTWICTCGATVTGKFCTECGTARPIPVEGWTCNCGTLNKGKFCSNCGTPKPAGIPQYKCDKCGWEPEDPTNPPKFCPECGDPFDDGDIVK